MGGVERRYKRDRIETTSPSLRRTNTAELTRYPPAPSLCWQPHTDDIDCLGLWTCGPAYWALQISKCCCVSVNRNLNEPLVVWMDSGN